MHRYLRAVGFSSVQKREDFEELMNFTAECYETEETAVTSEGEDLSERRKTFAEHMGLLVRGVYDDKDQYRAEYCIPYFTGKAERFYEDMIIERHAEKESYAGVCDDINLGASIIFYLQNVTEYLNRIRYGRMDQVSASLILSGLSVEGKILLPVYQKTPVVSEMRSSQERSRMLQAAREGDEEAIESLTMEDMDTYSMISRRIADEDVLSIVTTHFMPCGVECDHYHVMGEILEVNLRENHKTKEKIYALTIETNGIILDICINQQDLMGEPMVGRRFRGIIWLQGVVNFQEKW
ncbi:MAG: DUF3881 family protein [Lachnospiraceae bacterium]|nr:DUF3881 family protein [Lachnospiraceae bacterium]